MAGLLAARTGLAPAGHPGVDQALIDLRAVLRAEAKPFGDAGAEALDEHVGLGDQPQHEVAIFFALEVRRHRAAVAKQIVGAGFGRRPGTLAGTLDADDVGPKVTEEHRGVWPWADTGQFDDSQSMQWSSHV